MSKSVNIVLFTQQTTIKGMCFDDDNTFKIYYNIIVLLSMSSLQNSEPLNLAGTSNVEGEDLNQNEMKRHKKMLIRIEFATNNLLTKT